MPSQLKSDHFYCGTIGLMALAPLVFFPSLFNLYRLPKTAFFSLWTAVLLWLWLFHLIQERERKAIFPLAIPLALYLGASALSLIKATNRIEGVIVLLQDFTYISLFWLVVNYVRSRENIEKVLVWAVLSAVVVSLIGIYQMLFGDFPGIVRTGGIGSTFGNKNVAAQYILLILPLPYLLLVSSQDRLREFLFAASAATITTYFIYTGTRAAWVGSLVAFLAIFIFLGLKKRSMESASANLQAQVWRKKISLGGVLVFVLAMNWVPPLIPGHELSIGGSPSAAARFATMVEPDKNVNLLSRLAVWRNTLEMFKDHALLGVGKGNFKIVYPLYAAKRVKDPAFSQEYQFREAHNDYVQLSSETGILGLLSFFSVLGFIGLKVCRSVPGNRDPRWIGLILVLSFSIVGLLVDALVDFPFELPVSQGFFWLFAGFLWASCEGNSLRGDATSLSEERIPSVGERLTGRHARILVGTLSALSILVAAANLLFVRAEFYASRGVRLVYENQLEPALQEFRRAEYFNPTNHRYPFGIGLLSFRMGKYQEAIDANLQALSLHPNYINSYLNLGAAYASARKTREAEEAWKKALAIWPDYTEARNNLATIYALQGRKEEALALLYESLRRNPTDEKTQRKLEALKNKPTAKPR